MQEWELGDAELSLSGGAGADVDLGSKGQRSAEPSAVLALPLSAEAAAALHDVLADSSRGGSGLQSKAIGPLAGKKRSRIEAALSGSDAAIQLFFHTSA